MSFPGAAAGTLIALPGALGYYLACDHRRVGHRPATGCPRRRRWDSVGPDRHDRGARAGRRICPVALEQHHGGLDDLLFGSFLGITPSQVLGLAIVATIVLGTLAVIGRPLLFVSLDREAALALGVPVRGLEVTFLVMLGLTVAATTQITGALLVFALLVSPPAAALLWLPGRCRAWC